MIKVDNVFLGVSDESKAYRFFDLINKKVLISKDVIFEEQKGRNWEQNIEYQQEILDREEDEEDVSDIQASQEENFVDVLTSRYVSPNNYETPEGRVKRNRREPVWMINYDQGEGLSNDADLNVMLVTGDDLVSYEEAIKSKKLRDAMKKEIEVIEKNKTWELIDLPKGVKPIGLKWLYKTKFRENGETDKFKARLVVKGYVQQYGLDYTKVYAPIARLDTIRIILAIVAQYG